MSNLRRKIYLYVFAFFSLFILTLSPSYADNLMQVYRQAIDNDPTFKQAEADWLTARMNMPIAVASLLPNISAQAAVAFNNQEFTTDASFTRNGNFYSSGFSLSLYQPIFNWQYWKQIEAVSAQVKAATANYNAAFQDLMMRTTRAYFNVLQANDMLRIARANKKTLAQQYDISKQKFDVGLAPITDVYDSQAQYDQAVAQEIANQNTLETNLEALHEITGVYYQFLDGLPEKGTPLVYPTPNDIEVWSSIAERQNYQIMAQKFATEASKLISPFKPPLIFPIFLCRDNIAIKHNIIVNSPLMIFENENLEQKLGLLASCCKYLFFLVVLIVAKTRQARYEYASASAKLQYVDPPNCRPSTAIFPGRGFQYQ